MSSHQVLSIDILPVELIHRIFDHLDSETILFSLRSVCRLFRPIVNTYNRYDLNFELISKSHFYVLCRLIKPQSVISLTLSNDRRTSDQISLFLSLVCLGEFTRLRSLILLHIDEDQLNFLLEKMNLNSLEFFSFTMKNYDEQRKETTGNLLSSIFEQSTLRHVNLDLKTERLSNITWPSNSFTTHLVIKNSVSMDELCTIFQCLPSLHTLVLQDSIDKFVDESLSGLSRRVSWDRLKVLTIEKFHTRIGSLELFLLLTPSLVSLKLFGGVDILDGRRWKEFLEKNLLQLKKFEFIFEIDIWYSNMYNNLERYIASFQTSFWIEHKKWFTFGKIDSMNPNIVRFYSIPECISYIKHKSEFEEFFSWNDDSGNADHLLTTDRIKSFSFKLDQSLIDYVTDKETITQEPLFPQVTEISIEITDEWSKISLQSLAIFIDISRIVQISLFSVYDDVYNDDEMDDLEMFLRQAENLSRLILFGTDEIVESQTINKICLIIPCHVKHLDIIIDNIEQIKTILDRCEHLSIMILRINGSILFRQEVIEWFDKNTIHSTCSSERETVTLWLGSRNIQPIETNSDNM